MCRSKNHYVDTSAGGLFVALRIISLEVSDSALALDTLEYRNLHRGHSISNIGKLNNLKVLTLVLIIDII
jgi:hypothetical protein